LSAGPTTWRNVQLELDNENVAALALDEPGSEQIGELRVRLGIYTIGALTPEELESAQNHFGDGPLAKLQFCNRENRAARRSRRPGFHASVAGMCGRCTQGPTSAMVEARS
jgi:hypothetical protein